MTPLLFQDLLTARGNSSTQVIQTASNWLDLGDLEDVTLYLDVREFTGGAKLTYETSPSQLDSQFVALLPTITLAAGVRTDVVVASLAKVPPARFLRWRLQGDGSPWDASFRIWVAAYGWA